MASVLAKWTPEIDIQEVCFVNETPTLMQTWITGEEPWSHELSEMILSNCFWKIISVKNKSNFTNKFNSHLHCSLVSGVCSDWWSFPVSVLMATVDQEIKGHSEIFRMWKEISSESWVTQGWMRIGPHRAENLGKLPQMKKINRMITLILHFPFIITLSSYTAFLLRSSKHLGRYYLGCHHIVTVSESNDYYQLHFADGGGKRVWEWESQSSRLSFIQIFT